MPKSLRPGTRSKKEPWEYSSDVYNSAPLETTTELLPWVVPTDGGASQEHDQENDAGA